MSKQRRMLANFVGTLRSIGRDLAVASLGEDGTSQWLNFLAFLYSEPIRGLSSTTQSSHVLL
jgi:hypothetical protein